MNQEALDSCNVEPNIDENKPWNSNSYLWNAMISPLKTLAVKGFLWYHGESDALYKNKLYSCSFPAMIDSWRKEFNSNSATSLSAPFGFVQLSTIKLENDKAERTFNFPHIRWQQTAEYGFVPNRLMTGSSWLLQ